MKAIVITCMPVMTFKDFLEEQLKIRGMSGRAFARFVGVNFDTINNHLSPSRESVAGLPSVESLIKIAKATNTDICYLMALIDPDVPRHNNVSIFALRISEIIETLPEEQKELIDNFLLSLVASQSKKGS
jgi:transcriptional regulator with XRE-family HTH domain